MSREFDITIWGATGFTGGFVAEYFATTVSKRHPSLRWRIGGRTRAKLEKLAQKLAASTGVSPSVVVASVDDQKSIDEMVKETRVVLSTAGPFAKVGTPVVDACVRLGAHYTDITGETPWVRSLMDSYGQQAEKNGVFVVPMCGFDSIPSDLGSYFTACRVAEEFKAPARSVKGYFMLNGGPSGGTLASGQNMMNTPELKRLFDMPFLLGGGPGKDGRTEDADLTAAEFSKQLGAWTAPFGMAQINTRVVRRSAGHLGSPMFSPAFSYNECVIAPSEKVAKKLANPPPPAVIKRLIAAGHLPKPGSGPSAEKRAKSFFGVLFIGETEDGQQLVTSVKGGDPGYIETSKMVSEAALCLALGQVDQARTGGVLTPSIAFRDNLVTNLAKVGLEFKVAKVGKVKPTDGLLKTVLPSKL